MGNAPRKAAYPKSASSVGSATKKVRWGVGLEVPSPPGKPILVPGEEDADPVSVGIRWERSPHNGGTAIIGYIVELRKMGSPNWVRSAPFLCTFPELILSGLEPGWRYQFRVKAQNAVGVSDPSELSDPLTVTLQRAAAVCPQFDNELSDVIAIENDQVEFTVSFAGSPLPKISWYKDGFEIFSSRRTKIITENGKSNLLIHRTALDDEGEIKCTATNRAGHVSTKARLILEAPPRIRLPRQYADGLLFEQDETIRLKVSLAGKPHPTITWYHDGEPIIQDSRHVFDNIDGESTMKIPDAKRIDRGEYIVKASNKLGEDVASVLVTVTDRPAAPGKANVKMTLGRSVALSWEEPVDDGGCKIGTYIVEYYRVDFINVGWNMWLKATTSRQTIAVLNDLIEGSEYRFRVKAENPYGVSDPSEESDPIFIPDLKKGITTPNMLEKSQSSKEIHRGRSEKREVSFVEPSQRTRSLTREDKNGRSKAPQRSSAPVKPPRTDSRVTFALDTFDDKGTPSKAESSNHVNKKPVTTDPVYKLVLTEPEAAKPKEIFKPEMKQTTIQTSEKTGHTILKRQLSPEPPYRTTKSPDSTLNTRRQQSPEPPVKFQKQKSPELSATFGRQRSPEPSASFRRQQSPEPFTTSVRQKSPEPSTIFGRQRSPEPSATFRRQKSPEPTATFRRQQSPEPSATFRRQKSPEPCATFRRQKSPEPSVSPRRLRSPEPSARQRLSPEPSNRSGVSFLNQYSLLNPTAVSSNSKRSFFLNKSKSADEYDESALEDYNDHLMNDSSEFMLVLYPKLMTDSLIEKYESLDTDVHIEEITEKGNFQPQHQESSYETEDEDLIPPPISFSLPELFSPNHEIIEIMREAVSSTELLHEHAMERFYRAVEAEKAANEAKLNSANASNKVTKQDSFKLFDAKTYNPRRRLSNSGAQASWHVKKGRRRSHDQKGNQTLTELMAPGNLESVSSDSNLHLNKSVRLTREYETEKLHHWPKTEDYHFKDDMKKNETKKLLLEEEKVPSSGDVSIRSEDDVEFLKSRILAAVVAREEDTYHPSGRMVVHKELDEDMEKTTKNNNSSGTMPKSILKKRVETEPVPVNQFGRPIPPEVPIDRSGYQKSDPQIARAVSPTKTLSRNEYELMTDFEKDSVTVLSAAEAAKDRRKQVKQPSSSFEIDEEKLAEERMAVVSHYTEIVNEYSMAHLPFPPRPSSRQSVTSEGSSARSPQEPKVVMRDHRNAPKPDSHFSQTSFYPTPEPPTVINTKPEKSPVLSKIVIPLDKNQILMETESQLKSLQTQPEQRARSSSRTRRTSRTRSPSQPRSVSQSRSSSQTRAKARSRKSSNVDSNRPRSRMSSCDRSRADKKIERETKSQNNGIRSRRNSTHSNVHTFGPSNPDKAAAVENKIETDFLTQIKAEMNVKKTISFITDISLLFAAMYVYIFKREIFALPFILLLLYRHIQNEVKSLFSGRLFKSRQP